MIWTESKNFRSITTFLWQTRGRTCKKKVAKRLPVTVSHQFLPAKSLSLTRHHPFHSLSSPLPLLALPSMHMRLLVPPSSIPRTSINTVSLQTPTPCVSFRLFPVTLPASQAPMLVLPWQSGSYPCRNCRYPAGGSFTMSQCFVNASKFLRCNAVHLIIIMPKSSINED